MQNVLCGVSKTFDVLSTFLTYIHKKNLKSYSYATVPFPSTTNARNVVSVSVFHFRLHDHVSTKWSLSCSVLKGMSWNSPESQYVFCSLLINNDCFDFDIPILFRYSTVVSLYEDVASLLWTYFYPISAIRHTSPICHGTRQKNFCSKCFR